MKRKFKPGDLVKVTVFSYEREDIGIIIRELNWREMMEIKYDRGNVMWYVHFPDVNELKPFAEKWLVLIK